MPHITRDSLMTLESYAKVRPALRAEIIAHKKNRMVERCSGHDGTWGVKSEYFDKSMKIGKAVFRQMAEPQPDYVSSDCAIAARHILQGMGESTAQKQHPITLLRIAYGLE